MLLEVKVDRIYNVDEDTNFISFKGKVKIVDMRPEEEKLREVVLKNMTFYSCNKMNNCMEGDTYMINANLHITPAKRVFYIETATLKKIQLEDELEKFMIKHIKGVGRVKAKEIVKHLGKDALNIINTDEGLLKLGEIVSPKLALSIQEKVAENINIANIMNFLYENKLDVKIVNNIIDEYGIDKILDLENNPYLFAKCIDFKTLDAISKKRCEIDAKDDRRICAGVISLVSHRLHREEYKDLYTDVDDIYESLERHINSNKAYSENITLEKEEIRDILRKIQEQKILTIKNGKYVYMKNVANKEDSLFYNIRRLINVDTAYSEKQVIEAIKIFEKEFKLKLSGGQKEAKIKLSEEQKEAIIKAMTNQLSILTGLPGSGKTLTIKAIVFVYSLLKEISKIKQIAPTGKASKRMQEVSGLEAETIHRALKLLGEYGEGEMLDADFVVVDEASMIDIYLSETLFKNIKSHTKVLIVGDIEQLPSVGAGFVLRDMIESDMIPTTKLTKLYRQGEGSNIITNAHAIANKTMDFKFEKDVVLWETKDITIAQKRILQTYKKLLIKGESRADIMVLSPTRSKELGTATLNKLIQKHFNEGAKEVIIDDLGNSFREGDKVIHIENNYDLDVFNGEVGVVEKVKTLENDIYIKVNYGKQNNGEFKMVEYNRDTVKQLELAYALTVHKSQGSEYKNVISVLNREHKLLLTKNLIYTAWTRAKEFLVIISDEELIREVVSSEKSTISRKSNLADMLIGFEFSRNRDIQEYIDYDEVF